MKISKEYDADFIDKLTDDNKRKKIQFLCLYTLLAFISFYMTILNFITHKGLLTWATFIFALICILNTVLTLYVPKGMTVAGYMFMAELIALFTFFIVSGNPEGFSAIWICMLPSCGMLLYGRRRTTVLCLVMLIIMLFFFRVPYGQQFLQYNYTSSFKMRFPVLFVTFFMLSYFLETIRKVTNYELNRIRKKYEHLSLHDELTGVLNRHGLKELEEKQKRGNYQTVVMMDIDFFKKVNDTYGHDTGDIVLAEVAGRMERDLETSVCRWGGEEFVAWFPEGLDDINKPEKLRNDIEEMDIATNHGDIRVTVSMGAVTAAGDDLLEKVINRADDCLYKAKQTGRNKVVWEEAKNIEGLNNS